MEKVSVNKGLLLGIVAVAAAALLAVAFLLGRASGAPSPAGPAPGEAAASGAVAPTAGPASSPPAPAAVPSASSPEPPPAAAASFPSTPVELAAPPSAAVIPAPALASPARAAADPERAVVAAYLDAVGRIQPGQASGDPESVANEMAAALAKGDTSGLDGMLRDTEAAKARLVALAPPPSCSGHHRESLASLDDALEMIRSLKSAMDSPDPAAQLASVASRAAALRSRAEALQREELALRQRYGLAR